MKKSLLILGSIFRKIYTGNNLVLQMLGFVMTYVLVVTEYDAWWFGVTQDVLVQQILWPAVILGGILPIVVPPVIFVWGIVRKNKNMLLLGVVMFLAATLGLVISSSYKVFTGRIPPGFHATYTAREIEERSHGFQFGFYRGGAFNGWPSSHTTVAFAVSWAISMLYPRKKVLTYVLLLYAFYIGIGISTNIHWFSDFVAGVLLGTVIGRSVGSVIRSKIV